MPSVNFSDSTTSRRPDGEFLRDHVCVGLDVSDIKGLFVGQIKQGGVLLQCYSSRVINRSSSSQVHQTIDQTDSPSCIGRPILATMDAVGRDTQHMFWWIRLFYTINLRPLRSPTCTNHQTVSIFADYLGLTPMT